MPGNGPALQGGCQDPRWRIAEEGPGETGPVSITDGNSIPRSVVPTHIQIEYALLVDDEFASAGAAPNRQFWRRVRCYFLVSTAASPAAPLARRWVRFPGWARPWNYRSRVAQPKEQPVGEYCRVGVQAASALRRARGLVGRRFVAFWRQVQKRAAAGGGRAETVQTDAGLGTVCALGSPGMFRARCFGRAR